MVNRVTVLSRHMHGHVSVAKKDAWAHGVCIYATSQLANFTLP